MEKILKNRRKTTIIGFTPFIWLNGLKSLDSESSLDQSSIVVISTARKRQLVIS